MGAMTITTRQRGPSPPGGMSEGSHAPLLARLRRPTAASPTARPPTGSAAFPPSLGTQGLQGPARGRRLPQGVARAAVAGVEAAVFGWLCVVVPAIASYIATAAAPSLGEAGWLQAAGVGTNVWLLAHGRPISTAGGSVGLVPLGLSLLAVALVAWSSRRTRVLTWTGAGAVTVGYAAVVALVATVARSGSNGVARAVGGAAMIAAVGALWGLVRGRGGLLPPVAPRLERLLGRLPPDARAAIGAGTRGAGIASVALLGLGTALALASIVAGHAGFSALLAELRIDGFSTAMLLLATLTFLPTLGVWALAWLAGPGFAVGAGTSFAPDGVVSGPMPAIPALAGLPQPGTVAADLAWAPAVVVVVGALVGWRLHRRWPQRTPWGAAAAGALTALGCGGLVWLLALAASGPAGPGRMAEIGPDPLLTACVVAALVLVGAVGFLLLARPELWTFARRRAARARGNFGRPSGVLGRPRWFGHYRGFGRRRSFGRFRRPRT